MTHDSAGTMDRQLRAAAWRTSSFSTGGECVSVAEVGDRVALRNSNLPLAGTLIFTRRQVAEWVEGCKSTDFDDLTS